MLSRKHIYLIMTVSLGLLPLQGPWRWQRQDSDPQARAARTSIRGLQEDPEGHSLAHSDTGSTKRLAGTNGFLCHQPHRKACFGQKGLSNTQNQLCFQAGWNTGHEGHFVICFLLNQMSRISRQTRSLIAYYGSFPLHSTGTEYTNNK